MRDTTNCRPWRKHFPERGLYSRERLTRPILHLQCEAARTRGPARGPDEGCTDCPCLWHFKLLGMDLPFVIRLRPLTTQERRLRDGCDHLERQ